MDPDRFDRLFGTYADTVHRFALRRVPVAAAEDVVAETFLIAWRRIADVPEPSRSIRDGHDAARAWLLSTARWVVANARRGERRRDRLTERVAAQAEPSAADPSESVAEVLRVRAALAELSESDAEVLRLSEWDGLGHEEAARLLACTAGAYATRLHRARRRFATALARLDAGDLDPHFAQEAADE